MKPVTKIIAAALSFVLLAGAKASDSKLTERQRAMHALNRLRRGTRQPLSRFLTAIVLDYLADMRASRACRRGRRQY